MEFNEIIRVRRMLCNYSRTESADLILDFLTREGFVFTPSSVNPHYFPFEIIIPGFDEMGRLYLDHVDDNLRYEMTMAFVPLHGKDGAAASLSKILELLHELEAINNQIAGLLLGKN